MVVTVNVSGSVLNASSIPTGTLSVSALSTVVTDTIEEDASVTVTGLLLLVFVTIMKMRGAAD